VRRLKIGTVAAFASMALLAAVAHGRTTSHHRHGGAQARPGRTVARPHRTVAVGADEAEYRIRLTRSAVGAGPVVLEVRNVGQDPHDLVLRRADGAVAPIAFPPRRPGSRQSRTVTLTAGTWTLYCSLPGHEQLGMKATLAVK
jgi:hypothetical protein